MVYNIYYHNPNHNIINNYKLCGNITCLEEEELKKKIEEKKKRIEELKKRIEETKKDLEKIYNLQKEAMKKNDQNS